MPEIACIVEGKGDSISIPHILRRIARQLDIYDLRIVGPFRIPRQKLVRADELERAVDRAARSMSPPGGILVVIDADDDLACDLGPSLGKRAAKARQDRPSCVVLANREKEAWYIAALKSLRGKRGLPDNAEPPENPEAIRGAKEWLSAAMKRSYSDIADQVAFANLFDLNEARENSPSFDKLWRCVRTLLQQPAT